MTDQPKIPGGSMSVKKARQRWEAVRVAAQDGDPTKMLDAVQGFQGVAETMLGAWNTRAAPKVKAMVWEGDGYWSVGDNEGWLEEANTPFDWGYSIEFDRRGTWEANSTFGWSQDGFENPDEAKAAAQADFERRVRECLE